MARPNNVLYGDNYWGNGKNASFGEQNQLFYYDRAGIEASNADFTFQQFADVKNMPQMHGDQYRISVWHPIYDRIPFTEATWNQLEGKVFAEDFQKYGYLTGRNLADITNAMYGPDGKGYINQTYDNNGRRLLEGEGACNQLTIRRSTYTANLEEFGEMMEYTDKAEKFYDQKVQVRMRQQLGQQANNVMEDLVMLDLLNTPTVMYAGPAISMETMGTGIGEGTPDPITKLNEVEESYKVNWKLIQMMFDKMLKNRVPRHTEMLKGSVRIGTTPINPCFVALVGPEIQMDLENMLRGATYEKHYVFTPVYEYASQGNVLKNEFGRVHNIRFVYAERMPVERGAGAIVDPNYGGALAYSKVKNAQGQDETRFDVFPILVPGKGAFSTINLVGENRVRFTAKAPTDIDKTDPYGKRGFMTYRFWYGSIILRPERLLRVNVLASGTGNI